MKKMIFAVGVSVLMGILRINTASAANFQWGVEGSYVTHRFIPQYSYVSGRANSNFTNRAYGVGASVTGRYVFSKNKQISLLVQGSLSINDADWSLTTSEPATIEYDLPYNYDISCLPTVHINEKIGAFLEFGLGQGYIREKKESVTSSAYNFSDWTGNYILGAGVNYAINQQASAFIKYRYLKYNSISYNTYLADGTQVESVSDEPSTQMITIGVIFNL